MYLNYSRAEHFSMCMERNLQGRGTRLTAGQKLELFRGTAGVTPLQERHPGKISFACDAIPV